VATARVIRKYDRLAASLPGNTPAAFVLGAERAHGLAMARSLGRRGIPVVMLGAQGTPGMKSGFGFPLAIDGLADSELISLLMRLGEKLPTPGVLLPTGDLHVLLLSRHREILARHFRFSLAAPDLIETLADKRRQYEFAKRCGIEVPRTLVPACAADLDGVAEQVGFPCVIKPAFSQLWAQHQSDLGIEGQTKLVLARTPAELFREFERMTSRNQGVIVQEWIEGEANQLYAVYAYSPLQGEPTAVFIRRELRDWPLDQGSGCYSTSVLDPEVESLGRAFLAYAGYCGIANIEFKRDTRDGRLKLIEFNVRGASQLGLAVDAGVDIPFAAYSDIVGGPDARGRPWPVREGVRWIDLGRDALSAFEHRKRGGLLLGNWALDVLRARSFAYFAADDLGPALARTLELLRGIPAVSGRRRDPV